MGTMCSGGLVASQQIHVHLPDLVTPRSLSPFFVLDVLPSFVLGLGGALGQHLLFIIFCQFSGLMWMFTTTEREIHRAWIQTTMII